MESLTFILYQEYVAKSITRISSAFSHESLIVRVQLKNGYNSMVNLHLFYNAHGNAHTLQCSLTPHKWTQLFGAKHLLFSTGGEVLVNQLRQ